MTVSWTSPTALDLLRRRRDHRRGPAGRRVERHAVLRDQPNSTARPRCVYKPVAGERPLWDFPDGTLAGREVAAYAVSEATGWDVVPPTVLRDGPFGPGMCQLWIDTVADDDHALVDVMARGVPAGGWLHVLDALGSGGEPVVLAHADDERLRRMAVLDAVINNADRKGGHVLPGPTRSVHGVDHGVPSTSSRSCAPCCGAGRASRCGRRRASRCCDALREDLLGEPRHHAGRAADAARGAGLPAAGSSGCCTRVACRYPVEGWPAIPWPPF